MIIKNIKIDKKYFQFKNNMNVIFSEENSRGKTTLLRALLYCIGYQVPSTSGMDLSKYTIMVEAKNEKGNYFFTRENKKINIIFPDKTDELYTMPDDSVKVLSIFYGTDDVYLINNVLGVTYFDQEKGWTLLNRGKVIGNNRFSIEGILQGISEVDCSDQLYELSVISNKVKMLKNIKSLIEFKGTEENIREIDWESIAPKKQELRTVNFKMNRIRNKIRSLQNIVKDNEDIIDIIERMHLKINNGNGEDIKVSRDNIVDFHTNQEIVRAKIASLKNDERMLEIEKKGIVNYLNEQNTLFEITDEDRISMFNKELDNINIDLSTDSIDALIEKQKRLRKNIEDYIEKKLKLTSASQKIYDKVYEFSMDLGVSSYFDRKDSDYIFTKKVANHSGAELHLLVFAMRLGILKVVSEISGINTPIIIDSPSSGELDQKNLKLMIQLINKHFNKNQIIIATIINDIKLERNIRIKNRLLE